MASYQIPERFKKGFDLIGNLSKPDFAPILKLISSSNPGEGVNQLVEKGLKEGLAFSKEDLEDIFRTLFSIYTLVNQDKTDKEEVIQGLRNAFKVLFQEQGGVDQKVETLIQNIEASLIGQDSIKTTVKAYNLLGENEKVFSEGRIITDIRPVFSDSISEGCDTAVIFHKLRVDYFENSEAKQIYLALDLNDLNDLKKLIDRAVEKESYIRSNKNFDKIKIIEIKK